MVKILNIYNGLEKEIYILSMVRFVNCMGYFVIPFLSLYMTSTLSIAVGISGILIGIINFLAIPSVLIGGRLSDKYDSRKVVIIGQLLSALSYICVTLSGNALLKIIFASIGICFSNAITPAFDACIGRVKTDQKKSFALMYFMQNLGFGLGSLVIGLLYKINVDFVFLGDAFSTVISILILCVFLRSKKNKTNKVEVKVDKVQSTDKKTNKKKFFFVVLLNSISYGEVSFILPLYLQNFMNENYSVLYGILMSVNSLMVIIISPIASKLVSKIKLVAILMYGEIFFAVGYALYSLFENSTCMLIATILWSIGEVLFSISQMPYLIEGEKTDKIGYLSSVLNSFGKFGSIVSSAIGGMIVYLVGYRFAWIFIGLFAFVGFMIMSYLSKEEKNMVCKK